MILDQYCDTFSVSPNFCGVVINIEIKVIQTQTVVFDIPCKIMPMETRTEMGNANRYKAVGRYLLIT